ncbi:MAG: NAD(P)-binding protein [Saprospiraceae bacterium]
MIGLLRKYNWLFPVLVLICLTLGTVGFYQYSIIHGEAPDVLSSLYLSLQLFVLNSGGVPDPLPLFLEITRFLAPAVTASGIFLVIWEPFYENFLLFKIKYWKNHIVVCGLSKKAELLILNFLENEKEKFKIILIEPNTEHSRIDHLKNKGVIVLHGSGTDEEMLHKANIVTAKYLLALTNDEKTNILIAQRATDIYNQFPEKALKYDILQVIVHIDDFYTMNIFKEFHEKATKVDAHRRKGLIKIDYHVFSMYQLAATFMVDTFSPDKYVSLSDEDDPPAHLLILGDNIATQYLILEAAQMYHFANLKKIKITVVAEDKGPIEKKIKTLYPFLSNTVDIRYESTEDFFTSPGPVHTDDISLCFIALEEDGKSVYYARKLRQYLFIEGEVSKLRSLSSFNLVKNFSLSPPPIKVLLPRTTALVNIFDDLTREMNDLNIELFNMDVVICNKKTIVDNRKEEDFIAKHIHYEWVQHQAVKNKTVAGTMQEEWDKLKDAQKDSNRLPARHLYIKLRYVKAELSDTDLGEVLNFEDIEESLWDKIARMEHNRWNAEKYINGYVLIDKVEDRNLGIFLKDNLKCHWDLVSFDELDYETQEYDKYTFKMTPVIAQLNNKKILRKKADHT